MENSTPDTDDRNFAAQLESCGSQLVERLQNNNFDGASDLINELLEARDKHIFRSVGQLTRGLHNAIVNFHVDADLDDNIQDANKSGISDASDRLNYVIDLTQKAAEKTMDKVEDITPLARRLGDEAKELRDEWKRLKRREMTIDEFRLLYDKMGIFLDQMETGTSQLSKSLQDIILEQGFQDLTGQVLKKVIGLVTDVERELVNLMRIAGQVEQVAGLASEPPEEVDKKVAAEGPQIHAEIRDDVVSGQDDVDDLLSSLGF